MTNSNNIRSNIKHNPPPIAPPIHILIPKVACSCLLKNMVCKNQQKSYNQQLILDLIHKQIDIKKHHPIMSSSSSSTPKYLIAMVILSIAVVVVSTNFGFDVGSSIVESNREWTRCKVGVTGTASPYEIFYDQYPTGWNQVLNYIYIPAEQRTVNRKYPCKIRARAADGSEAKATVVFIVSDQNAYLSDLLFSYDQTFDDAFFNSGIFKGRPQLIRSTGTIGNVVIPVNSQFEQQASVILKKLNTVSEVPGAGIADIITGMPTTDGKVVMADVKAALKLRQALAAGTAAASASNNGPAVVFTNGGIQGVANGLTSGLTVPATITLTPDEKQLILISQIKSSQASEFTQERSIESIFFKLPGPQELDSIITTADSFALIKTIQKVISSDLTCEQKSSYLSDFFGRIQSAISMKAFAATQLKVIVDGAQGEIDRLNKQITRNQQAVDKLGVKQLRDKLSQSLVQLEAYYNKFNAEETKVVPKQASIDVLRKNIETIRTKSESNRQQLPVQKLQLNEVNANIAKIEQQLKSAIANRTVYETNINKLTQSVSKYDSLIQTDQTSIDQLELEITKKQDDAQKLKTQYQTLQIQIERQRKQITTRQKRVAEIQALIPNLEQRLLIQKRKIDSDQLSKVRTFVSNLQTILPNVTSQIDQINFKCNQVKQVETVKQNDSISYVIQPNDYNTYIQKCYRVKPETKNIKVDKFSIWPVGILDKIWRNTYGDPYNEDSYARTNEFNFNQDFGCLAPSALSSSSGVIRGIGKRYIDCDGQGGAKFRLNLGACSRLESTNSMPQVGQRIYFKGQKAKNGDYNLYRGSCL